MKTPPSGAGFSLPGRLRTDLGCSKGRVSTLCAVSNGGSRARTHPGRTGKRVTGTANRPRAPGSKAVIVMAAATLRHAGWPRTAKVERIGKRRTNPPRKSAVHAEMCRPAGGAQEKKGPRWRQFRDSTQRSPPVPSENTGGPVLGNEARPSGTSDC